MFVLTNDRRIEYVAADSGRVADEMDKLLTDLALLLETDLTITQGFFFAALLHLVFVKIHSMADGNGRTARPSARNSFHRANPSRRARARTRSALARLSGWLERNAVSRLPPLPLSLANFSNDDASAITLYPLRRRNP